MSEIRPELHLWVAYLEKKEELEEAQDRIAELKAKVKMWRKEDKKKQTACEQMGNRIAELEAALLNLIEHTLDCELELDKLHGLGNGAGAGMSSILCEAHAALEGRRDDPAA